MNCTALIPAAGIGQRFGSILPKQYTRIHGQTVLAHSIHRLLAEPRIERIAIVLAPDDTHFAQHIRLPEASQPSRILPLYCGGKERADSVRNGIHELFARQLIDEDTQLLVHDAARCCLPADALARLIDSIASHPTGAILALPVADTLKYSSDDHHIDHTQARQQLWQAQTPQRFPAGLLRHALEHADPATTTDEASAVEQLGQRIGLIQGDSRNLKLTLPSDETIVRLLLSEYQQAT